LVPLFSNAVLLLSFVVVVVVVVVVVFTGKISLSLVKDKMGGISFDV